MKHLIHFSRLGALTVIAGSVVCIPVASAAIVLRSAPGATALLLANASQGYLGVALHDVDTDRANALKLKDAKGAEIISIDQDAPAAKSSLKVHDVVIQMNGQRIESVEQFRRMLRETPPGHTVSLIVIREGQPATVSVQLGDRAAIAYQSFEGVESDPPVKSASGDASAPIVLPGASGHGAPAHSNGFFGSLIRNRYYVGVELESLPTGLADYFGVRNGVLVGNVFANSPAAVAGLKPADVIQKVNGRPIVTLTDWEKAIKVNHGKQVQVTIIRDKKEQTLVMLAGEGKNSGELRMPATVPPETISNLNSGKPAWGEDPASFGEVGGVPPALVIAQLDQNVKALMRSLQLQQMD